MNKIQMWLEEKNARRMEIVALMGFNFCTIYLNETVKVDLCFDISGNFCEVAFSFSVNRREEKTIGHGTHYKISILQTMILVNLYIFWQIKIDKSKNPKIHVVNRVK